MPKAVSSKTYLLGIFIIGTVLLTAGVFSNSIFASDKCESIQDLDDRAKCYENKIEDKQEEYETTSKKLSDIRSKKDAVSATIASYQNELNVTQAQIDSLQNELDDITKQLDEIEGLLTDRKGKLSEKIDFRNKIIRNYSKRSVGSDLEFFFSTNPLNSKLNGFEYASFTYMIKKYLTQDAVRLIYLLNSEIDTYEKDKAEAESLHNDLAGTQSQLLALKSDLSSKKSSAQNEYGDLSDKQKNYENELFDLEAQIDELTSKQQAILNQKYGEGSGSVGDYEPPKSSTPNPPSKLGRPVFAAFSYGAFTHYNGMSQFGAQGRAKYGGESWKDIIKHYYGYLKLESDYKEPSKILVKGDGVDCNNKKKYYNEEVDFNKYLGRIYEMPSSWDEDALKVQAVAARTYAIRIKNSKGYIEPNQNNQVYKNCDNAASWINAVKDTKGYVLLKDGSPALTEYSSTTGGYLNQSGWDVSGSWPDGAYEKKAGSPWFRKAWYIKNYNDASTCGRDYPWLSAEEMADIINAWRVWVKGSSSERSHISPVTTSCWGGDPYSNSEMRDVSSKYGGGYKKLESIKASIGNNGTTTSVEVKIDGKTFSIDGQTFKTVYNLRAPSYIAIRSRLFDFEKEN